MWRYLIDKTESIEPGKPVIIWRVDVVYLEESDWKYEKSGAGTGRGGRTHTFGVRSAAENSKAKLSMLGRILSSVQESQFPEMGMRT